MEIHPLIERFGMFSNKDVECYDKNKLFIKSGLTVISALAGVGKSTYIIKESEEWKKQNYKIFHFNFDNAPTYNAHMIEPPISEQDFNDFFKIAFDTLTENDIIVIDSLKSFAAYKRKDIESNTDMYETMMNFRLLIKKTNCSIILVHHVYAAKNVKTMPLSFYGSRAIEEQCDSGFIYDENSVRIVKSRAGYRRDETVSLTQILKDIK